MQTQHYWIIGIALAAALVVAGLILFTPKQAAAPGQTATSTGTIASTTTTGGLTVSGSGATVTQGSTAPKPPATPALVITSADIKANADATQALNTQWQTLTTELKAQPTRVDLWLELGTTYKLAGQYDAAIAAWTYVGTAAPASLSYVAWGNLGDLYLNFLHDYAKAAVDYRLALKGAPNNPDYQAGLKAAQSHL